MKYFGQKKSRRTLYFGLLFLITVWTFCIYYIKNFTLFVGWVNEYERPHATSELQPKTHRSHTESESETLMYITDPNRRSLYDLKDTLATSNNSATKRAATDQLFEVLSNIVQHQLYELQQQDCSKTNLFCGHHDFCGLGCQIHHRTACLIISYALGVPLIHDPNKGWPFTHRWDSAFSPLGSKCKIGPQTYRLKWTDSYPILYKDGSNMVTLSENLEYPLKDGIPVSREMADIVELIHERPFDWWIGQFIKYVMQLSDSMKLTVENHKKSIHYTRPIVGMHIRRTDKLKESDYIPAEKYFAAAEDFFNNSSTRKVFVASEDISLLNEVYTNYSSQNWDIIGFKERRTYSTQTERRGTLSEIVTDLFLLAESDFVVCGFSSNVCRLLVEMRNYMYPSNGTKSLTSLDDKYSYILWGCTLNETVVKIG